MYLSYLPPSSLKPKRGRLTIWFFQDLWRHFGFSKIYGSFLDLASLGETFSPISDMTIVLQDFEFINHYADLTTWEEMSSPFTDLTTFLQNLLRHFEFIRHFADLTSSKESFSPFTDLTTFSQEFWRHIGLIWNDVKSFAKCHQICKWR